MTRALKRSKVVRFLNTQRCPFHGTREEARMGKGKAAGFHSCADGFAVCRAAPCVIRHEHGAADRGQSRRGGSRPISPSCRSFCTSLDSGTIRDARITESQEYRKSTMRSILCCNQIPNRLLRTRLKTCAICFMMPTPAGSKFMMKPREV